MKVLFLDTTHASLQEGLEKLGCTCDLDNTSSKEDIITKLPQYDALVIRSRFKLDASFLDSGKHLKFIARVGAGLENIDCEHAEDLGIHLISCPEGNRQAVGEQAVGMLLMLFNNLRKADQEVRDGKWIREGNRGVELQGKCVGIIGYGNMGGSFARCLQGFRCEVLTYDIQDGVGDQYARQVALEELFEKADILSIHTPLTEETAYMVNRTFIDRFKKPIYFINTARGPITKTDDLAAALKSGKVLGACLDVLEYEKTSFENLFLDGNMPAVFEYLISSENVVLSPHIAGWTHESNRRMSETIILKVKQRFFDVH